MQDIYFTTKVATPKSFCDREQESRTLSSNIKKNQHTVVVAPRRYGKTSLIMHTLETMKIPFACIDLFCVVYEEDVCQKTAKAISSLVKSMASFSERTVKLLEQSFKSATIAFKAGQIDIRVDFGKSTASAIEQLDDLLNGLETFAAKHKQPVILFLDEFQDVLKVDESNKIQATIRSVAQHAKYVNFIFSGSSRMMLNKIFDAKNQPLYMLCSKILLDRIPETYFQTHIAQAAKRHWKSEFDNKLIDNILALTEAHTFYVNLLCDKLWELDSLPTLLNIQQCWDQALLENRGKVIADLEPLNTNRLKVLTTIALLNGVNEPNSKLFLDHVKLPLSSTQNAIRFLLNHDYLFEKDEVLRLVDPLMKKFIVESSAK